MSKAQAIWRLEVYLLNYISVVLLPPRPVAMTLWQIFAQSLSLLTAGLLREITTNVKCDTTGQILENPYLKNCLDTVKPHLRASISFFRTCLSKLAMPV